MSVRYKVTGYIELEQTDIDEAEGQDPINALPDDIQAALEEIEMVQVTEEG